MEQKPGKETSKKDVGQTDMEYVEVEGGEIRCYNILIQFFYPGYEYIKKNNFVYKPTLYSQHEQSRNCCVFL